MSAATRTVQVKGGEATYDSDMPMSALRGLLSSATEGDLKGLMEAMTGIVLAWPYKGDPNTIEGWDALKRSEFNSVVTGVTEDLGELGE